MAARMVNAVPTANTNLAGFGFGAMFPSWLFCWYQVSVLVPDCRIFKEPIGEVYELLHSSPLVQKMMGRLTIRDPRPSYPGLAVGAFSLLAAREATPVGGTLRRSSAAVVTSREGHRSPRSGREGQHRRWGRECQAVGRHEIIRDGS